MIQFDNVSKHFDSDFLTNVDLTIAPGTTLGLLGSNGSGKSTLLRLLSGIYQPDQGRITVDNQPVYNNIAYKKQLFFAPDEPFFFGRHTLNDMRNYYASLYAFDDATYNHLLDVFGLQSKKAISTFSKGQKRQSLMILGLSTKPKYLLLDEIFDGLDVVMKNVVKKVIAEQMADTQMTTVITTHNLSELDNLCDHLALMHTGRVILHQNLDQLKGTLFKVQLVSSDQTPPLFGAFEVVKSDTSGNIQTFIVKSNKQALEDYLTTCHLTYFDIVACSIEDLFITELEATGYGTHL